MDKLKTECVEGFMNGFVLYPMNMLFAKKDCGLFILVDPKNKYWRTYINVINKIIESVR